jgi:hypothetical protein
LIYRDIWPVQDSHADVFVAPKCGHGVATTGKQHRLLGYREDCMRFVHLAAAAVLFGGAAGLVWPVKADPLPMDQEITVNGIETACTGIGDEPKADPRWKAYPIRVEFSNGGAQYLSGAHVTLSQGGKSLTSFDCSGAWVLFKNLKPGSYKVSATITDQPGAGEKSVMFSPPATGQKRVVIEYPVASGK